MYPESPIKEEKIPLKSVSLAPRFKGLFIKGPIDMRWLGRAAKLPGHSLHVGLLLWFRMGCESSHTVRLTPTHLKKFGVRRHTGYRALKALEKAGLVRVERHRGRAPVVTVVRLLGV